jgi:ribosome recycling factor
MVDKVLKGYEEKLSKTLGFFKQSLMKLRTGRASLMLVDGIMVDYYGTKTPLKQIANLATPEPKQITIQPWDPSVIKEIERSLLQSDLGITPVNDGKMIRITIPPLTEERRKELTKLVKKMGEECKVTLRGMRRDTNEELKSLEKNKQITEDDTRKTSDKVQKILDDYIKQVDESSTKKEKDLMEI